MAGGLVGYLQYAFLLVTSIPICFGGLLGLLVSFLQRWDLVPRMTCTGCSARCERHKFAVQPSTMQQET